MHARYRSKSKAIQYFRWYSACDLPYNSPHHTHKKLVLACMGIWLELWPVKYNTNRSVTRCRCHKLVSQGYGCRSIIHQCYTSWPTAVPQQQNIDRVYQQLRPAELHEETEVSKPHTVPKFNPLTNTKELASFWGLLVTCKAAHNSSSSEGHLPSYHLIVKTSWEEVAALCGLVTIRWPCYTVHHAMMTLGKIEHSLYFINRVAYNEYIIITKTNMHLVHWSRYKTRKLNYGIPLLKLHGYTCKFLQAWNLPVHLSWQVCQSVSCQVIEFDVTVVQW